MDGSPENSFVMGRTWVIAVMAAALLASSACSKGRDEGPGTTVPSGDGASGATTTTADAVTTASGAAASYEVPEVVDQAYVQRVVSAYDKVLGDAIRILKRDGAITEDFLEHLLAIYTEPEFEVHQRLWLETVANGRIARTADRAGDPVSKVIQLVDPSTNCVIAKVDRDFGPTFTSGQDVDSPEDDYVVLVRRKPDRDPAGVNPTPWVMSFDGFKTDNSEPRNSCDD